MEYTLSLSPPKTHQIPLPHQELPLDLLPAKSINLVRFPLHDQRGWEDKHSHKIIHPSSVLCRQSFVMAADTRKKHLHLTVGIKKLDHVSFFSVASIAFSSDCQHSPIVVPLQAGCHHVRIQYERCWKWKILSVHDLKNSAKCHIFACIILCNAIALVGAANQVSHWEKWSSQRECHHCYIIVALWRKCVGCPCALPVMLLSHPTST